ncbi:MAG: hypothetical protein PWQ91_886 [Eubacteriales bacterium]|nr:hypothetical protein [Eubacteriales bacterium]MDN5363825.1 hypothetical protein [Eubacteriales bacterium]
MEKKLFEDDEENCPEPGNLKEVKGNTTDPESGLFYKGEKERCFAYTASVACDKNNFVLGVKVAPGNVHDSQVFPDLFQTHGKKSRIRKWNLEKELENGGGDKVLVENYFITIPL